MQAFSQILLVLIALFSFYALGNSSLIGCIRIIALQGMCLGILPLLIDRQGFGIQILLIASGMFILKGFLIPRVLSYAIREVKIRREMEPLIGYNSSLLIGAFLIGISFLLAARLPLPDNIRTSLLVPVSLSVLMMGMLMMIVRVKAVTQVIGYLMFENGIYLFGLAISYQAPWLIEMGVLLDVFVAVFVMGIVINHIARAFDSINTENLTNLGD